MKTEIKNQNANKKRQKLKTYILLFFLFIFYITISAISYASTISNNLSNEVLRLHVIANSNSEEDQALKYKVRDSLLNYMTILCNNTTNKEDSLKLVTDNLKNFKEIAEQTILENGFSYSVHISIGNYEFPTKNYADISLPAGMYDALKVEIGTAAGENWWCVMFPPLCFSSNDSDGTLSTKSSEVLENTLSNEEYSLISEDDSSTVYFKFKLIELFSTLSTSNH